jgi:nucleoside-triphosphatase
LEARSAVWLITGPPAIGKSTVLSRVILGLRSRGLVVGGCITKEVREMGTRVGFRIEDLLTGREGQLASIRTSLGPKVGRYRVNLRDTAAIGARALLDAAERAEIVAIDEVGPMELVSPDFRRAAEHCLDRSKPILAVIHERMKDPLAERLELLPERKLYTVTLENRGSIAATITEEVLKTIRMGTG